MFLSIHYCTPVTVYYLKSCIYRYTTILYTFTFDRHSGEKMFKTNVLSNGNATQRATLRRAAAAYREQRKSTRQPTDRDKFTHLIVDNDFCLLE